MKKLKSILKWTGIVLGAVIVAFAIYVASRQNLKFERPAPAIQASQDPKIVARGEYVVRRVAECSGCHGDPKREADLLRGDASVALSGGHTWKIPPGTFRARNITPDAESGIGKMTDGEFARALRYGVGQDGRALLPFMEMQGISDDDLVAIISYLRLQTPVKNAVPMHEYSLLGKIVRATLLAEPVGPKETPLKVAPRGPTLENGRYLAEHLARCWGCHTERSMKTGELVGPRFAGGRAMPDPVEPLRRSWNPPNITSAPKNGKLAKMSEDQFVTRLRAGRVYPTSPMPWDSFSKWDEDDLRAVYRYLKSVPAAEYDVGPAMTEL